MWDLAGFRVEGSPVGAVPWDRPPSIEIDGDRLRWRYVRFAGDDDPGEEFPVAFGPLVMTGRPMPTAVGRGMLLEFVGLPQRDVSSIAAFAGRWGVLHLCSHELPRTHPQTATPLPGDTLREGPFCQTVYGEELEGSESLIGWVWWARRARAVLRIASVFAGSGKRVDRLEEWSVLLPAQQVAETAADIKLGRVRLAREVETWLRVGAVVPRVDLLIEPRLRVAGWELFGMIALQLALAVTAGGFAFCHECGQGYTPKRQPVAGRRTYCDECRHRKVPGRDAARDSRRRPPQVRRLRGPVHASLDS